MRRIGERYGVRSARPNLWMSFPCGNVFFPEQGDLRGW